MSFGLPSLLPTSAPANESFIGENAFGVSSPMISGLCSTNRQIGYSHPLEVCQKNHQLHSQRMDMAMLRNTQGMHAPMRLAMEIRACEKIGRLPFLPSSNAMKDALFGWDEQIGFEDILNTEEFREQMGQPHAVVEKSLGIL